jgi:predicted signal transduction protein with EAL and GGDEF domain
MASRAMRAKRAVVFNDLQSTPHAVIAEKLAEYAIPSMAAGDALLRQVVESLTSNLGDANLSAPVGADHFAAGLPAVGHDGDELMPNYRPKVNLESEKVTSTEALIRWNDPRTGLVPAGRFLPILAHSLKLKVVAEGVETEEQPRLLRVLACDQCRAIDSASRPSEIFETRYLASRRESVRTNKST